LHPGHGPLNFPYWLPWLEWACLSPSDRTLCQLVTILPSLLMAGMTYRCLSLSKERGKRGCDPRLAAILLGCYRSRLRATESERQTQTPGIARTLPSIRRHRLRPVFSTAPVFSLAKRDIAAEETRIPVATRYLN
jgi:hypothetical protein